jgi:hypothetical protein
MEAKIYHVAASHLLGRNPAGETVFFTSKGEVRDAKVGDTLFFNPEKPAMVSRGGVKWFGKNARFAEFEPEPDKPDVKIKGLPEAHAKNYDNRGHLIIGPRPCDLAAQRTELAKHTNA